MPGRTGIRTTVRYLKAVSRTDSSRSHCYSRLSAMRASAS